MRLGQLQLCLQKELLLLLLLLPLPWVLLLQLVSLEVMRLLLVLGMVVVPPSLLTALMQALPLLPLLAFLLFLLRQPRQLPCSFPGPLGALVQHLVRWKAVRLLSGGGEGGGGMEGEGGMGGTTRAVGEVVLVQVVLPGPTTASAWTTGRQ